MYGCLLSPLRRRKLKRACMLDILPTELLLEILSSIAPSIPNLTSLVGTNRRFYRLAAPLLLTAALGTRDRFGGNVIRRAAAREDTELLHRLLLHVNGGGLDERVPNTVTTALHPAIMLEQHEAMMMLLRHGAGVNVGDRKGWSALHWAVLSGNCGMVEELLNHSAPHGWGGGNGNSSGMTPLHMAPARGDTEMAARLIRWGANVEAKDGYGMRAVDYAVASPEGGEAGDGGESLQDMVGMIAVRAENDVDHNWLMWRKRMMVLRWGSVLSDEKWLARRK